MPLKIGLHFARVEDPAKTIVLQVKNSFYVQERNQQSDMLYRGLIATWLGRGPCAVANEIGIAEDFDHVRMQLTPKHTGGRIGFQSVLWEDRGCQPDSLLSSRQIFWMRPSARGLYSIISETAGLAVCCLAAEDAEKR
jgi:hypothetical protein